MVDRIETDVSPFKPGGRFVEEDGTLTGDGYRFLDQIWKRTGGFADGAWDSSAIAESLQTQISELNTTVEGLLAERGFEGESQILDLLQRVEALEAGQSAAQTAIDYETSKPKGRLSAVDLISAGDFNSGAVGFSGDAFNSSHTILSLPASTPTNAATYNTETLTTNYFRIPKRSRVRTTVSYQFRAPSDLFNWFYYKYSLELERESGGSQVLISDTPIATSREETLGWVSGNMAGANYDRVEPFGFIYQLEYDDLVSLSTTGRYRLKLTLEPDDSVVTACTEGWGTTVTGTFAWENISLRGIVFNSGPIS